jgi:creatinine amidohydrolase
MSKAPDVILRKHTRREFRERMNAGELKACIIPLAAIEQHLEHLAMEHDWRSVTHVAAAVAEQLRPNVIVTEGMMAGVSEHHMKHPGTVTLRVGSFLSALEDIIDSMVRAGFGTILVLNGHGGNVVPCESNWDQLLRRFQVNLQFMSYWDVLTVEDAKELLKSGSKLPVNMPGHAQEFETSIAMHLFPKNVRMDALADQPDPTPAMSAAETGGAFVNRIVERVAAKLKEMIDGKNIAVIPPFHP